MYWQYRCIGNTWCSVLWIITVLSGLSLYGRSLDDLRSGFLPIHYTITFAGASNFHNYTENIVFSRIVISPIGGHCTMNKQKNSFFSLLLVPSLHVIIRNRGSGGLHQGQHGGGWEDFGYNWRLQNICGCAEPRNRSTSEYKQYWSSAIFILTFYVSIITPRADRMSLQDLRATSSSRRRRSPRTSKSSENIVKMSNSDKTLHRENSGSIKKKGSLNVSVVNVCFIAESTWNGT